MWEGRLEEALGRAVFESRASRRRVGASRGAPGAVIQVTQSPLCRSDVQGTGAPQVTLSRRRNTGYGGRGRTKIKLSGGRGVGIFPKREDWVDGTIFQKGRIACL